MSKIDYEMSLQIERTGFSFVSLIMAAARKADSDNAQRTHDRWPEIFEELQERYNSVGGYLPNEIKHLPENHIIRRTMKAKGLT